mgnify:CR=1 FL=1
MRCQQQHNTPTHPKEKGLVVASLRHWKTKEDHAVVVVAVAVAVGARVVFACSQRDRHRVGCGWEVVTC